MKEQDFDILIQEVFNLTINEDFTEEQQDEIIETLEYELNI